MNAPLAPPLEQADWESAPDGGISHFGVYHRVIETRTWANRHGCVFHDWRSACGGWDTTTGDAATLRHKGSYYRPRKGACPRCWS